MRSLGDATDREEIAKLASRLPDGDAAVADALKGTPSVLGFVLNPAANTPPPPGVPVLVRGHIEVPEIWQATGAIGPLPTIAATGHGFGAMVLAGDANGEVRRVPLLVAIGGHLRPGFAVEMLKSATTRHRLYLMRRRSSCASVRCWSLSILKRRCGFCRSQPLRGKSAPFQRGELSTTRLREHNSPAASYSSAAARPKSAICVRRQSLPQLHRCRSKPTRWRHSWGTHCPVVRLGSQKPRFSARRRWALLRFCSPFVSALSLPPPSRAYCA